jgi:hypothetical protein
MWNLPSARLGFRLPGPIAKRLTGARLSFLAQWAKTIFKLFFVLWVLLTWVFQGTPEGGAIWALLLTVFIGGGAVYLRWHDGLSDQDVLTLLNPDAGSAGLQQFRGNPDLVGAEHE